MYTNSIDKLVELPKLEIYFEHYDKDGNIIKKHQEEAHSFTRNFWNHITCMAMDMALTPTATYGPGHLTFRHTTTGDHVRSNASPNTYISSASQGYCITTSSGLKYGVVVGVHSDCSFVPASDPKTDYKLYTTTTLPHNVDTHSVSPTTYDDTTKIWTRKIGKIFTNNTGATVHVCEAGLMWRYQSGTMDLLMARDKVTPQSVDDQDSILVQYILTKNFSPIDS